MEGRRRLPLQQGREGCDLRRDASAEAFLSSGLRGILYLSVLLLLKFKWKKREGKRSVYARVKGTEVWLMLLRGSLQSWWHEISSCKFGHETKLLNDCFGLTRKQRKKLSSKLHREYLKLKSFRQMSCKQSELLNRLLKKKKTRRLAVNMGIYHRDAEALASSISTLIEITRRKSE